MIDYMYGEFRECYHMLEDLLISSEILKKAPNLTKQEFFENHVETTDRIAQMFDLGRSTWKEYREGYDIHKYVRNILTRVQSIMENIARGDDSEEDYDLLQIDELFDLLTVLQLWFDEKNLVFAKKGDKYDS